MHARAARNTCARRSASRIPTRGGIVTPPCMLLHLSYDTLLGLVFQSNVRYIISETTEDKRIKAAEMTMKSRYLDEARRRVLVYDGAMGTQIHNLALRPEDYGGATQDGCPEILVLTRPD